MGLCLSKKQQRTPPSPLAAAPLCCAHGDETPQKKKETKKKVIQAADCKAVVAEVPAQKKLHVLVAGPTPKKSAAASFLTAGDEKRKGGAPGVLAGKESATGGDAAVVGVSVEDFKTATVRTSSCKEEVDAILIQCGRLSRSSSGAGLRRYSGSKRSYDFDNEKEAAEEGEKGEDRGGMPVSRPSPRRRTPGRDRSWSRERRGNGAGVGGRSVDRSPGRRSETPAASRNGNERSRQPAKMASLPAREKAGRGVSPTVAANRRGSELGAAKEASHRSRSPANVCRISTENSLDHSASLANQLHSLSRSSPRKAEQSPCRRNPMTEVHENTLRRHHDISHDAKIQKTTQVQSQKSCENSAPMRKSELRAGGGAADASNGVKPKQVMSERTKEQEMEPEKVEEAMKKSSLNDTAEMLNVGFEGTTTRIVSRTRSSRRCSRDLDHALGGLNIADKLLNPNSYTSMLLEDTQNFHQQHQGGGFSLPACISKACSILDAVADLNSASSENKNHEGGISINGHVFSEMYERGLAPKDSIMESEIVVKDDLMEPSLHKYVTVRDLGFEREPQESAGSNSYVGQPWASPWGPDSVDSSGTYWTSSSINGDEVEQEHNLQQPARPGASREPEAQGRRFRAGSGSNSFMAPTSSSKRRELQRTGCSSSIMVASGRTGGKRTYSPAAAAASS